MDAKAQLQSMPGMNLSTQANHLNFWGSPKETSLQWKRRLMMPCKRSSSPYCGLCSVNTGPACMHQEMSLSQLFVTLIRPIPKGAALMEQELKKKKLCLGFPQTYEDILRISRNVKRLKLHC